MRIEIGVLTYSLESIEDPSSRVSRQAAARLASDMKKQLNKAIHLGKEVWLEAEVRKIRHGSVVTDIGVSIVAAYGALHITDSGLSLPVVYAGLYVFVKDYDKLKANIIQIAQDIRSVSYSSYVFFSHKIPVGFIKGESKARDEMKREIKPVEDEARKAAEIEALAQRERDQLEEKKREEIREESSKRKASEIKKEYERPGVKRGAAAKRK